ncbi:Ldh family oxidoreductase [Chelativorans salis]|uniref:Ldh family oxidoreductase n=1 Tax=Chelativorans salis TaxID=2978478 RepID=A0ABT2LHX6_9HYPH|nr:Ldh family oxidoreductase [Chelativorans sp. EGI FJ00035]MCT7374180.1 Ldh family oxidoreductase [Chelativorans sp. EGI FJ00035]
MAHTGTKTDGTQSRVTADALERFCRDVFAAAGADTPTADAATCAMMHGSRLGIDSHGVRLLEHYVKALTHGRVNPKPKLNLTQKGDAAATLDADDAHGALAAYTAMEEAVKLAQSAGLGAVAIRDSSHFGPAGAYAHAAAEAGVIGIAMCNSDSFVRLHEGAQRFHGTNPIACAVPVPGERPWLLDMATSAIPFNRIQLYKSLGQKLPPGTASRTDGGDTDNPAEAEMLAPLGGKFGFKGAGLAGLVEIFSAVLTGTRLSFEIAPMFGSDFSTPRGLGAFVLALKPGAFVDEKAFADGMTRYLAALRGSTARAGGTVLAPGDREWAEADRRAVEGIPLDPATLEAFRRLADRFGIEMPRGADA